MGGTHDHPSPVQLQIRLKWYILGKYSEYGLSEKRNTEIDQISNMIVDLEDVCQSDSLDEFESINYFEQDECTTEMALFNEGLELTEENFNDNIYEEEAEDKEENTGIVSFH